MGRTARESRLVSALSKVARGYVSSSVHKIREEDLPPHWNAIPSIKKAARSLLTVNAVKDVSLDLPSVTGDTSRVLRAALSAFSQQSKPCSYEDVIDQQLQLAAISPIEFERDRVFSTLRGFIETLRQVMTTPRYVGAKVYSVTKLHDEICLNIMGTFMTSLIGENMCRKYRVEIKKEFKISRNFKVFTCVIPRRVGKTFTITAALAVLAHCRWLYWGKSTNIGLYAQDSKQARGVANEIAQVLVNLGHVKTRNNQTETNFESGIHIFKGSSRPDGSRGQGHDVIFVDEAYYTNDDLFEALAPLLQVEDAIMIAATTDRAGSSVKDILCPVRNSSDEGYDSDEDLGPREMRDMLNKSRTCRECLDFNNSVIDVADRRKCYHTCMEHPAHLVDDDGSLMECMLSTKMLASEVYGGDVDGDHRYFNPLLIEKLFGSRNNSLFIDPADTIMVIGMDPSPGTVSHSAICVIAWNMREGTSTVVACESMRTAGIGVDPDTFVEDFITSLLALDMMMIIPNRHRLKWFVGIEACGGTTAATQLGLRIAVWLQAKNVPRKNIILPRMKSRCAGETELIEYGLPLGHYSKGLLFHRLRADINSGKFLLASRVHGLSPTSQALIEREKRLAKQFERVTLKVTRNERQKPTVKISGKKNATTKNDVDFNDDMIMAIITALNGYNLILDSDHTILKSNVTINPSRVIAECIISEEQVQEARSRELLRIHEIAT